MLGPKFREEGGRGGGGGGGGRRGQGGGGGGEKGGQRTGSGHTMTPGQTWNCSWMHGYYLCTIFCLFW